MKISVIDLHSGNDTTETDKIIRQLNEHSEVSVTRLFSTEITLHDPSSYDGIVLSGSDTPSLLESSEVVGLKYKIVDASNNGVHILGICAGNELLGSYFGYRVYRMRPEIGWPEVYLTQQGINDPLFNGLPPVIRPFQYHSKGVKVDDGIILAKNERFAQGILYAPTARGIQFHPEDSPRDGIAFLKNSEYGRDKVSTLSTPENYVEWRIFRNFVDMIRK